MINIAILTDYNDKFVGVVGHNYQRSSIFYKVKNQFLDNLLEQLFNTKVFKAVDIGDMEVLEEIKKEDKDYLETIITKLELYKVKDFIENLTGELQTVVKEKFQENLI